MRLEASGEFLIVRPETTNEGIQVGKMFMYLLRDGVPARISSSTSSDEEYLMVPIKRTNKE